MEYKALTKFANFYERLVFKEVARWSQEHATAGVHADMLADVACASAGSPPRALCAP